jgi:aldose 1-epimerase
VAARAPSGVQVGLKFAGQSATVVGVGAGLRSYHGGSGPLFDGYDLPERCSGARGHHLIPWPNRLRDGRYEFDGVSHQLPLTEPAKHNAIHGLARWMTWEISEQQASRAAFTCTLNPQAGWPFTLDLRIDYELGPAGLSVRTSATNAGPRPCPYGAGAHPYLRLGPDTIDGLRLRSPGGVRMLLDAQGIPAGREPVDGTSYDFRAGKVIGSAVLDTGYLNLDRAPDGLAWVTLTDDSSGAAAGLWMDREYRYLMLFTGDSLADPARRRRGLGVEPMTCPPNALQTGDGLRTLAPGETFTSRWGISPLRPGR